MSHPVPELNHGHEKPRPTPDTIAEPVTKSDLDIKNKYLSKFQSKKLWLQLGITCLGGISVLFVLGLIFEPFGQNLARVPAVGVIFEGLCRSVKASCNHNDEYLVLANEEVEGILKRALPAEEKDWLKSKIGEYRNAINRNPKNAAAWTNLGEAFRRLGKTKEALEAHQKALEIEPNQEFALIGLAKTQMDLNKWTEANKAIKTVLTINPSNEKALALKSKLSNYYFSCRSINGVPTTVIQSDRWGERQIIRWVVDYEFDAKRRCQETTNRLNKFFRKGGLYITHGVINGQPVICTTDKVGNGCKELLFTLKPSDDPEAVLEDLFGLNNRNFADRPLRL